MAVSLILLRCNTKTDFLVVLSELKTSSQLIVNSVSYFLKLMFFHMHIDGFSSLIPWLKSQHTDNTDKSRYNITSMPIPKMSHIKQLGYLFHHGPISYVVMLYVKYIPNIVDITSLAHSFLPFSR